MRRASVGLLAAGVLGSAFVVTGCRPAGRPVGDLAEWAPGLAYTNTRIASEPWSIHVVRVARDRTDLALETVHAGGRALGLSPLTEQITTLPAAAGKPVAAVNGDFYQRDRPHAGDPRGLQIASGELLSAPNGGVAFWLDASGGPHTGTVISKFRVEWPDGSGVPIGLNQERGPDEVVLFTESAGPRTHTPSGRELILVPEASAAGQPVRWAPGARITARIREIREQGDSPVASGTWVLSLGPGAVRTAPRLAPGTPLVLSAATDPDLTGCRTAIGGGPVLLRDGQVQRIRPANEESYEFSSMRERHPRSAIGWNGTHLFLVLVDGRQPGLSVGMTLEELGETLRDFGCTDAMNLDGGGSATLWADGRIRNTPCDGEERPIANALVVSRRPAVPPGG